MAMDPVVHFEMPYKDAKRLSKFYTKAFGWNMKYIPKMGKYVLATTTPVDKKQMHLKKGAINGGFYPKGIGYGDSTHMVISVKNLEKSMVMIKKSKGKIKGKPMDIPGVGKFVMAIDTEGNRVGVLQASRK